METPQVRPGVVRSTESLPRVVAYFYNSAQGNAAIQLLTGLGIPNDRLGVTVPDRIEGGQGMVLSIACPEEAQISRVEALCRAQGAEVHRQRRGNAEPGTPDSARAVVLAILLALSTGLAAGATGMHEPQGWTHLRRLMIGTLLTAVLSLYTESAALVPALQSYWLVIHVSVAFISSALFTVAFSATVLQLVQDRREALRAAGRPPVRGRFMDALPSARELDTTAYRLIAVSFPLWTFTLVAGAIWAEVSWGRYWNWDPKEVWTFVIWVVYAAYLHARATGGWSGRRAAYLAVAGYLCVLVNFGVVNVFFPGNHSYAGIG